MQNLLYLRGHRHGIKPSHLESTFLATRARFFRVLRNILANAGVFRHKISFYLEKKPRTLAYMQNLLYLCTQNE